MKDTLDLPGLNIIPLDNMIEVPVYKSLIPRLPLRYQNDIIGFNHLPSEDCDGSECLGFLIQDDSMDKERITVNSVVTAKEQSDIENDTLFLVYLKDFGVTVRRVYCTESSVTFYPESNNASYTLSYFRLNDKGYYVFGKVISVSNKV